MTKKDAMLFPVMGSAALLSLYIAFKLIGKEYMNMLLTTYLIVLGVVSLAESVKPLLVRQGRPALRHPSGKAGWAG